MSGASGERTRPRVLAMAPRHRELLIRSAAKASPLKLANRTSKCQSLLKKFVLESGPDFNCAMKIFLRPRRHTKISRKFARSARHFSAVYLTTAIGLVATLRASFAQQITSVESAEGIISYNNSDAADASEIIFSNLASSPNALYNPAPYYAFSVAGRSVHIVPEELIAISFTPKVDVQAKVLLAAIGYIAGTKRVNLGIYADNGSGTVGTLLPGGQGSTTHLPDIGVCCQLAKVTLPGAGVTLSAGTTYWLVASPDDVNAPTFNGSWQLSYSAMSAAFSPPYPWSTYPGKWPAAQIRGSRLTSLGANSVGKATSSEAKATDASVTLFTNLNTTSVNAYDPNNGAFVGGNNVTLEPEQWDALPFTVKTDSHAKTLAAAIGYISGTKKVNLGIYSDSGGTVGTLLPGGQGSTTQIPDSGDCCGLTQVKLQGAGVALTAGTQYWLVASTDDVNAADFEGRWRFSTLAVSAYTQPRNLINWNSFDGYWLAAEIRGTNP